jgi:hypothetical protein
VRSGNSRIDCSQGAVAGSKDCWVLVGVGVVVNDRGGACPAAELLNERGGEKLVSRILSQRKTEQKKKAVPHLGSALQYV